MIDLENKKIVFLFTPGPLGGAEKIVAFGIRGLLEEGIDVSLWVIKEERVPHVTDTFIELLQDIGICSRLFSSLKIFDRRLLSNLRRALSDSKPDIIHAHGFKAAFYGKLAAHASSALIITHHGKSAHTIKVRFYEFIEDQVMKRSNAVIAVSQDMKRKLLKAGIRESKISVVENFLTTKIIKAQSKSTSNIELLFVGRLSPEKGCNILIESIKILEKEKISLTSLGDGIEKVNLEKKVRDLQLESIVHFFGFKQNVNEYMASSDAIVMPSYREGQPLTLIEACCMGLPVVASNVGGIPDLINENENGYLCPPGDSNQLANALKQLLVNIDTLKANSQAISTVYEKRFLNSNWAKNTLNVYRMVLSQS
jgi:glycosyltransferase involved in cell wall biosynthesis